MAKHKISAAVRMLNSKRKLVKRLKSDIADVESNAAWHIAKIKSRINVAETLIDALEKGTLKP